MKIRSTYKYMLFFGGAILLLAVAGQRLNLVKDRCQQVQSNYSQTFTDAQTIIDLRSRQATIALNERPKRDVIALVRRALADAGLAEDRFVDLRNESDVALPQQSTGEGPLYRKQSLSLSLKSLSISDFGRFLVAWKQAGSIWVVSRITLSHPPQRSQREITEAYDVNLVLSALYVGEL